MLKAHTRRGLNAIRPPAAFPIEFQRNVHVFKQLPAGRGDRNHPYPTSTDKFTVSNDLHPHRVETPIHVKRNEVGVQLLSRKLHAQIFRNISFPAPPRSYVQIAKEHLAMHGLDPTQGSVLPDIGFQLPPLQGSDLLEHFHRIGIHTSEPWLSLAKAHASSMLPPKPDYWEIQSGWTKYYFKPDGTSYFEPVDYPSHNGRPEAMLTFDVETMPNHHPYPIMACAASENAWYAWISPWLLKETHNTEHLVPMGDSNVPRVIIGHNVSYDRQRIREEYSLEGSQNRFIDTMSLHAAVSGISSHQRPAWVKHRNAKQKELDSREEEMAAFVELIGLVEERLKTEADAEKKGDMEAVLEKLSTNLNLLEAGDPELDAVQPNLEEDSSAKRWEDVTAANSLADVAKLHCGIHLDKEIRNDLMHSTPESILDRVGEFLDYCASDVHATHEVYRVVLPAFFKACPHPVSFSGMLVMGSSFLPVNHEWDAYLQKAEAVYQKMQEGVQSKLIKLAMDAFALKDDEDAWKNDPWLSQLDWTPKAAKLSRGIGPPEIVEEVPLIVNEGFPSWFATLKKDPFSSKSMERILPLILQLSYDAHPLTFNKEERWHYVQDGTNYMLPTASGKRISHILSRKHVLKAIDAGKLSSANLSLTSAIAQGDKSDDVRRTIFSLADIVLQEYHSEKPDPWISQLDWSSSEKKSKVKARKAPPVMWPKWYWEAAKPRKDLPPGTLDITVRNRIAPILLRLSWMDWPLHHSREHGWIFRVPTSANFKSRTSPLDFYDPNDETLNEDKLSGCFQFYKLPHKDGEQANVGSPLGKGFVKYAQNGVLRSRGGEAKEALELSAVCSYWISTRDRIMNQMVVWQRGEKDLGFSAGEADGDGKWGIIIPQVVSMGTVTRRAIEKTWLTASNAKKDRVGSELKAMVRAPQGYAIVGADVDSEELWISSCMGDAQFGLHGASAIGWMTLEGTKAAGTDLHSKTAQILKISRDQAKVFNYSRIYGAGMRHAVLLLLQSSASMLPEEARKLAENLYSSTKGKNTHRTDIFNRKFWFGGTESYLFNKLEEIALSGKPKTPALDCGVTDALSKEYLPSGFGSDYLPSRINWVVQSSGVDYLHLLMASMEYLISKYDIRARYLISVHDELRYLVIEEDKYRIALALQIANLWTRSIFACKLGMDDLPQGVAFFSAVDVDTVLRKEVFMPCVTPSQPTPIPPGESLDIEGVLDKTHGGSLYMDGRPMLNNEAGSPVGSLEGFERPECLVHRSVNASFLRAQATSDFGEVKGLAQQVQGVRFEGNAAPSKKVSKKVPIGTGEDFDWSDMVERLLKDEARPL